MPATLFREAERGALVPRLTEFGGRCSGTDQWHSATGRTEGGQQRGHSSDGIITHASCNPFIVSNILGPCDRSGLTHETISQVFVGKSLHVLDGQCRLVGRDP